MKASLPMYDLPALRAAHTRYWSLIREQLLEVGIKATASLNANGVGLDFWTAPDLILSQTCGMPYRRHLHGKVQIIGTPDYGVAGCAPGYYNSVLIKRRNDPRNTLARFNGARAAINEYGSQSGFAALAEASRQADTLFAEVIVTGAHAASVRAVADGSADIAAIDAVTWALLSTYEAAGEFVTVFESTAPTPGLPYICSKQIDRQLVFDAVDSAMEALAPADRETLMLRELVFIPSEAYTAVPSPAPDALIKP
ncbi:phosphate/phosphite/phosphonate ABC transporter substrate-binding protein [Sulfitobacter sp. JB4-11]|uniref:phosphate/phosphite/phosphonate ABC transporter substrate-binding protein n=1 Tax=Sulfitobacter rhodophyticola TaxID=3238304 RepID=UPI0035114FC4